MRTNIYNSNLKLFSCAGSQADQVCYLSYPHVKRPRKIWLPVLKVNPRQAVEGKFVLLQQTVDEEPSDTIEEIIVDNLADRNHPAGNIDFEIGDADPEDEFHCNLSSSEDDYNDPEDDYNENIE